MLNEIPEIVITLTKDNDIQRNNVYKTMPP